MDGARREGNQRGWAPFLPSLLTGMTHTHKVFDSLNLTLSLRHIGKYFVKYQNIVFGDPTDGLKYRKCKQGNILRCMYGHVNQINFGDGFVRSNCMDTSVARPITQRRARNLHSLKYGLGKAKNLSLTDWYFSVNDCTHWVMQIVQNIAHNIQKCKFDRSHHKLISPWMR